ncbi:MAG: ester cyclase [Candidatus Eisenbacteria bacterium]|uniref:Ester cyclase n=1 Tax=Eiseniibacteriota bacterium TaxID=2212470 RepID=A0A538T381_UNCEI|nr:MAG: ester cyclase [Candidatus Eisenbacteria bacterium]
MQGDVRSSPLEGHRCSVAMRVACYRTRRASIEERRSTMTDRHGKVQAPARVAWDRLHESHSKDVLVHWPDGHTTQGIERHIEDLKAMFVYAPDTRILVHPVKFGSGDWTSVIGEMEGTFTKPMPTADGKSIAPTGKPFKLAMCTVGHWKGGVMDEEYLFWDNQAYMKQIGLAP